MRTVKGVQVFPVCRCIKSFNSWLPKSSESQEQWAQRKPSLAAHCAGGEPGTEPWRCPHSIQNLSRLLINVLSPHFHYSFSWPERGHENQFLKYSYVFVLTSSLHICDGACFFSVFVSWSFLWHQLSHDSMPRMLWIGWLISPLISFIHTDISDDITGACFGGRAAPSDSLCFGGAMG